MSAQKEQQPIASRAMRASVAASVEKGSLVSTEEASTVLEAHARRGSSKTFVTKTDSGKKLRVTFRDSSSRSDSQSTEDSTSSQNTVVERASAPATSKEDTLKAQPSLSNEAIFEKLKKELLSQHFNKVTESSHLTTVTSTGQPRVTVLRRASITPSMTLSRSMSTTNSTIASAAPSATVTSEIQIPTTKTVSYHQAADGSVVAREVRFALHKRQSSLNGTSESTSSVVEQSEQPKAPPPPPPPPPTATVETKKLVETVEKRPSPQLSRGQSPAPVMNKNQSGLPDLEGMPAIMKQLCRHFMASNMESQQADLAGKIAGILEQCWNRGGARGVDIAEEMCRDVRNEGAISLAFNLAASNTTSRELRLNTFRLLVSSFSSENRFWFVNQVKDNEKSSSDSKKVDSINDLGALFGQAAATLRTASSAGEFDPEMCLAGFGIVRSLMAHSNETCCTALDNGVLEAISSGLRVLPSVLTSSPSTELNQIQSTLSASIATMTTLLQSPSHHQQLVSSANAVDRLLLPVCLAEENPVAQYFSLISAVSFYRSETGDSDQPLLAASNSMAAASTRYGTDNRAIRASIASFLSKPGNSPSAFPFGACSLLVRRGPMSITIKPEKWLKRFLDTAICASAGKVGFAPEIQGMALFHIAVELERVIGSGLVDDYVKSRSFIEPLIEIAESPNNLANRLAASILMKIGTLQHRPLVVQKLSNRVPAWSVLEVRRWLTSCVGLVLDEEAKSASEFLDGDLLLTMPLADLRQALFSHASNKAKLALFARHLMHLKLLADYNSYDSSDVDGWLSQIAPNLRQYTYALLHAGIDRHFAVKGKLDGTILTSDCGITNGVHRQQILSAAGTRSVDETKESVLGKLSKSLEDKSSLDMLTKAAGYQRKWLYDVFICYKRASGSQLASLLKVYLEIRGFRVFLDVTDLPSGRCYERLVETISASRHFLLLLTGGSLDGVIGDEDRSDWVHREIYAALTANCNIIPVSDSYFTWPSAVNSLPEDVRSVCNLNTIKWLHDYQDACVDKIEKFIIDHDNNNNHNVVTATVDGLRKPFGNSSSDKITATTSSTSGYSSNKPRRGVRVASPAESLTGRSSYADGPHNPPIPNGHFNKTVK